MVAITEMVGIDEFYTIVAKKSTSGEDVGNTATNLGGFVSGLVIGGTIIRQPTSNTQKKPIVQNPVQPIISQPQSIIKSPFDNVYPAIKPMITKKEDLGKDGAAYDSKIRKKIKLGVQNATVFRSSEQIGVDRIIQRQKKELRSDLKNYAKLVGTKDLDISKLKIENGDLKFQVFKLKETVAKLQNHLASSNIRLAALQTKVNTDYVTKEYHKKHIYRLQGTLEKYSEMATGISTYPGPYTEGYDTSEIQRSRRKQQRAALQEMSRSGSGVAELFGKISTRARVK